MQNWDSLQPANYEHNWYSNMFHQTIKQEPQSQNSVSNQLEHYLSMKQQELSSAMTPSPRAADSSVNSAMGVVSNDVGGTHHYFDSSSGMLQQHHPLGFNPLTPPGLPSAVLPSMAHFYSNSQATGSVNPVESVTKLEQQTNTALTPRNTPPMDVTPPKSPKASIMSTSSELDQDMMSSNSSEDMKFLESEDDESIRMPIYNSHGKMKNYKCKTCGFLAITKVAFWEHARSHMKPEKTLQCSKCPFVTELKHHLEYHIRKHKNLKPFQCDKCNYSCVNKSMLNSHRKSHSSVYQYRCSDCDYATKYCHSFKLHLRKYDHKPGMVLDEDGAPNPSVVIDVYGTRRGPKMKSGRKESSANTKMPQLSAALQGFALNHQQNNHHNMPASPAKSTTSSSSEMVATAQPMIANQHSQPTAAQRDHAEHQQQQQQQQQLSNLLPPLSAILQQQRNLPFFPYWNLNLQMLAAQQQAAVLAQLSPRLRETAFQNLQNKEEIDDEKDACYINDDEDDIDEGCEGSAIDLSAATPTKNAQLTHDTIMNLKMRDDGQQDTPLISSSSNQLRRKGRVLKLDQTLQIKANTISPEVKTPLSPPPTEVPTSSSFDDSVKEEAESNEEDSSPAANSTVHPTTITTTTTTTTTTPPSGAIFECKYCDIYFRDAVLYTIHMGYHSCDDVFKCNMCGEKCDGPVGLFVHMARNAHS